MDVLVIWDLEDDVGGNVQHVAEHGLDMDEVEDVLLNPQNEATVSYTSGRPVVFGYTSTGKYIAVVYEHIDDNPRTIYPVTAYEAPEPKER